MSILHKLQSPGILRRRPAPGARGRWDCDGWCQDNALWWHSWQTGANIIISNYQDLTSPHQAREKRRGGGYPASLIICSGYNIPHLQRCYRPFFKVSEIKIAYKYSSLIINYKYSIRSLYRFPKLYLDSVLEKYLVDPYTACLGGCSKNWNFYLSI